MGDERILRIGGLVIAGALAFRLILGVATPTLEKLQKLQPEQVAALLLTGRILKLSAEESPLQLSVTDTPQVVEPAVFSPEDQQVISMNNSSGKTADAQTALLQPLNWSLQDQQPTVLILHSHGSESYTKTEDYTESANYRTLNTDYNMISIGQYLAEELEKAGIRVIHDQTMYDSPSYNEAYTRSRAAAQQHLTENPSICLVLDLHRDAGEDSDGNQIRRAVSTPEGDAAQLMMVLGTNHEGWLDNLSLAVKLQVQLEKQCSNICRPISVRAQRYNQDLCSGALLVEVGAAGNTRQEALLGAKYLAQAIISLAAGAAS